jgi:hypothetical protein
MQRPIWSESDPKPTFAQCVVQLRRHEPHTGLTRRRTLVARAHERRSKQMRRLSPVLFVIVPLAMFMLIAL